MAARELVLAYHDVFALESNELGCTRAIEHEIGIENSKPFKQRFWRIPPPLLEEVCTSPRDMLEAGVIHPSQSPWCNTVVLVRKKDGTLSFCVDFRCLNMQTKKDSYPLPHIQEALESMVGSAHFSQWISSQASGKSRWLQSCSNTRLSWWVTSGSSSSPTCHSGCVMPRQLFSDFTLGKLNLTYCMINLDDVIVFGCTEEEHLEHLCIVFERFWEFNLKLKPSQKSATWLTKSRNGASC